MRKLLAAARITALDIIAYRSLLLMWVLIDSIQPLSLLVVWLLVYQGQTTIAGFTKEQMVLYYLGVFIVTLTVTVHNEWDIREDIRHGKIRMYLTKPLSYTLRELVDAIVWRCFTAVVMLPIITLVLFVLNHSFDIAIPELWNPAFLLSLVVTLFLYASWSLSLGYLTFFMDRPGTVFMINGVLRWLLSGYVIPIALLAPWLKEVLAFTPYPYLYDFPIRVLVTNMPLGEFWSGIGVASGWVLVFALVATLLWQLGVRRYDAPEGLAEA